MVFSARLPSGSLADLCRNLRHYLHAGLTLRDAVRSLSTKGPANVRAVVGRIGERLERGETLEDCLRPEAHHFPPLFTSLVVVGEKTGMLVEVFGELERHYARQQKLQREFISRITWPVMQFFIAVFVLAGMIYLIGALSRGQGPGTKPFDPLGLGLSGEFGAMVFLGTIFGGLALVGSAFLLARKILGQGNLDAHLLRIPAIGPCLLSLAMARFCTALRLTMDTAMPIGQALKLCLLASGNQAFTAWTKVIQQRLRQGESLTQVLAGTGLFPELFMSSLAVAEESGQVPEVMKRLGESYHEEAGRRLTALTAVAGYGVWLFVAGLMVVAIFRMALAYINLLN